MTLTAPDSIVLLAIIPLAAMPFAKPLFGVYLQHQGYRGANGSEQVVPGFAILFALYLPAHIAISFFREHGLNTWIRLRASELRLTEIVAAKLFVWGTIGVIQQATLFIGGWLLFGLRPRGSLIGLFVMAVLLVVDMGALGIMFLATCRTANQVWALGTSGSLVIAGLGGAIVPTASLPGWAASISPAVPSYWAMRGFRSVILQTGGLSTISLSATVLCGFSVAFILVGLARLRIDEPKEF